MNNPAPAPAPALENALVLNVDEIRILHAARQRKDGQVVSDLCEAILFLQAENVTLSKELAKYKALAEGKENGAGGEPGGMGPNTVRPGGGDNRDKGPGRGEEESQGAKGAKA